ncbi:MAG: tryptophan halogenase family protein [Pseudomonadales bacterium]
MVDNSIKKVVVVGGGTAGWMAAALLGKLMGKLVNVELVESDQIGTVGVGEATIPQIRHLTDALQISEQDFLKAVQGTYKLGIEFNDWGQLGDSYIHTFGDVGRRLGVLDYHQVWLRGRELGLAEDFWGASFNDIAARANKFAPVEKIGNTGLLGLGYAFHFDATLVAKYLRNYSEPLGVKRTEGHIKHVLKDADSGFITGVQLEDGRVVEGDLFIDCSGFRSLLLGDALETPYVDWSHWLPCNSAQAVPTKGTQPLVPYTKATARKAGWQWRIPLQHRVGNGHVYSSDFITDAEATDILLRNLDAEPLMEPKQLRFTTGKRENFWVKNCIALGLASGFMEPLESTSIHLVQSALSRLIDLFPTRSFSAADIAEYNQRTHFEYDTIRDFLILHYKATTRDDSEFWNYCRNMSIPDTLQNKFDLWQSHGRFFRNDDELFTQMSWVQVLLGQNIVPDDCHPIAKSLTREQVQGYSADIRRILLQTVDQMPSHADFIAQHIAAPRLD